MVIVVYGTLKNSDQNNLIKSKSNKMKRIDFSVLLIGVAIITIFVLSSCGGRRVGCPINATHSFGTGRI